MFVLALFGVEVGVSGWVICRQKGQALIEQMRGGVEH